MGVLKKIYTAYRINQLRCYYENLGLFSGLFK